MLLKIGSKCLPRLTAGGARHPGVATSENLHLERKDAHRPAITVGRIPESNLDKSALPRLICFEFCMDGYPIAGSVVKMHALSCLKIEWLF